MPTSLTDETALVVVSVGGACVVESFTDQSLVDDFLVDELFLDGVLLDLVHGTLSDGALVDEVSVDEETSPMYNSLAMPSTSVDSS